MSHAASLPQSAIAQQPHARGFAFGWGVSLLVHALAVGWVWHAWPAHRAEPDAGPVSRIEVRLVPVASEAPRPAPAPDAAAPRSVPTPTHEPAAIRPAHPPHASAAPALPAVPAVSTTPAASEPQAAASAPAPAGPEAPTVDLTSARAAARAIAREEHKGLVALPERKPVVDPNADHHVVDRLERARRVNCESARAESTNLLANVVMLAVDMTKNAIDDSGCKW